MTNSEFVAWLESHRLSNREAARILGLSRNTVNRYVRCEAKIPRVVALATKAVDAHHGAGEEAG